MLDDLDRALIHALHIDGRAPFNRIATALDVPRRPSPVATAGCAARRPCGSWGCRTPIGRAGPSGCCGSPPRRAPRRTWPTRSSGGGTPRG
ncbi:AsnC family protein [Streptomyces lincolnensis]|uniref:AsnC family protein n=1 Tax=Streptomyces lincolnensis TaxID=1915 RepID=UPI001CEF6B3E|nr:AsnC family protein [Streptomyces lincolnensis]